MSATLLDVSGFAQAHQDILLAVRDAVGRSGTWVTTKPEEVVRYLAPQLGMSEEVVTKVIRAQPWGFSPSAIRSFRINRPSTG